MRNLSCIVFEDIWMNTRTDAGDDVATAERNIETDAHDLPDWDDVEDTNAILNPDPESMNWRG
jgi:hypothetical protein